jgi:hypothetical protein
MSCRVVYSSHRREEIEFFLRASSSGMKKDALRIRAVGSPSPDEEPGSSSAAEVKIFHHASP